MGDHECKVLELPSALAEKVFEHSGGCDDDVFGLEECLLATRSIAAADQLGDLKALQVEGFPDSIDRSFQLCCKCCTVDNYQNL